MKFTLSWLKKHLDTSASLDEILSALTDLGLEVESVENPVEKLEKFTIGKVLSALSTLPIVNFSNFSTGFSTLSTSNPKSVRAESISSKLAEVSKCFLSQDSVNFIIFPYINTIQISYLERPECRLGCSSELKP